MLPPRLRTGRKLCMISSLLFKTVPEDLASIISQEKEIKACRSERKKNKIPSICKWCNYLYMFCQGIYKKTPRANT